MNVEFLLADNGVTSTVEKVISVPSQPGDPVFYSNSSSLTPERYVVHFLKTTLCEFEQTSVILVATYLGCHTSCSSQLTLCHFRRGRGNPDTSLAVDVYT